MSKLRRFSVVFTRKNPRFARFAGFAEPQGLAKKLGRKGRGKLRVLAVPRNRIAAFKSEVLKQAGERGGVSLSLDKEAGSVTIESKNEDGGSEWIAEQVLRAVALGFEPKHAFKLFNDDYFLEEVDLKQALGKEKAIERQKARIIGSEGKVKKTIESLSGAFLAIGGGSIAILGRYEDLKLAKDAVYQLLEGKQVSTVYDFLEKYAKLEKQKLWK